MGERDPVLEALYDGHKNLGQISGAIRDAAYAFRALTDAVTVLLIFLDEAASYGRLSDSFQKAVDNVKGAMEEVAWRVRIPLTKLSNCSTISTWTQETPLPENARYTTPKQPTSS